MLLTPEQKDVLAPYLQPGYFINSDDANVIAYTHQVLANSVSATSSAIEKTVALYYAIRDGFMYNPYKVVLQPPAMRASFMLTKNYGYCIEKACLLAACARVIGVPSRLGFANVRNHIGTEKLEAYLQTDVLVFHGYTDLFLEGNWVKATPAFNKELCEKQNVAPMEFNGLEDSIFQEYDSNGGQFMEYLVDHGTYHDVPFDNFKRELLLHYGHLFSEEAKELGKWQID